MNIDAFSTLSRRFFDTMHSIILFREADRFSKFFAGGTEET